METQPQAETALYDPNKKAGQLVEIECKKCGYIGDPKKWGGITLVGILYLVFGLNIFVLIFILLLANQYICSKYGERNQLTKILNNRKELPIKSLSKKAFSIISAFGLILMGLIYASILMLTA